MIDEKLLERLSKSKDADVKELVEDYKRYTESPLEPAYVSILKQINHWLDEINKSPINIKNTDDSDNKAFEKAHKLMTTLDPLFDKLEYLRAKMSPERQKKLEQSLKDSKMGEKDKSIAL